jgi:hypothetical protein
MFQTVASARENPGGLREEGQVVEVSLLLTVLEFDRLAEAASRRGVSIGQMVREIMREPLRAAAADDRGFKR